MKSVCKTNIEKNLRESWNTAETIPINDRWACGITVKSDDVLEFSAVIDCDGTEVANVRAWCDCKTAKKDIIEYASKHLLTAYRRHSAFEAIDLAAIDTSRLVGAINDAYDRLYSNHDHVNGHDEAMACGDWLIRNRKKFVGELIKLRHDVFSSDREVAALGFAVHDAIERS